MKHMIVPFVCIVVLLSLFVYLFTNAPKSIKRDYSAKVEVAKSDEIENAISNVISDVRKRDFILIEVEVIWVPARSCYSVKAKGITRDKLLNLKP